MEISMESLDDSNLGVLPIEILRLIVAELDSQDLERLRSINRRLKAVSDELFLSLSFSHESIAQLLRVASSNLWSSQVQHVKWTLGNDIDIPLVEFRDLGPLAQAFRPVLGTAQGLKCELYLLIDLQCRLLRELPNVRTIRFHFVDTIPGYLKEPSGQGDDMIEKLWLYPKSSLVPRIFWPNLLKIIDMKCFTLLSHSEAKPDRIETPLATSELAYSEKGHLRTVHTTGLCQDPDYDLGVDWLNNLGSLREQSSLLGYVKLELVPLTPPDVMSILIGVCQVELSHCILKCRGMRGAALANYRKETGTTTYSIGDFADNLRDLEMEELVTPGYQQPELSIRDLRCENLCGSWSMNAAVRRKIWESDLSSFQEYLREICHYIAPPARIPWHVRGKKGPLEDADVCQAGGQPFEGDEDVGNKQTQFAKIVTENRETDRIWLKEVFGITRRSVATT